MRPFETARGAFALAGAVYGRFIIRHERSLSRITPPHGN